MTPRVVSVSSAPDHRFSKGRQPSIRLLKGLGVEGDAHAGVTVKHRSRVARDPTQPNLRQVHLVHAELFDELAAQGFDVVPGAIGENITTRGIDLLALPAASFLRFPSGAEIRITGLRNPCAQLDGFQKGLMAAMLRRDGDGTLHRLAGIMGVVTKTGTVSPDDPITVARPGGPQAALMPV